MKSWLKRLEALAGSVFKPNSMVVPIGPTRYRQRELTDEDWEAIALQALKDVGAIKEPDKNRYYTEEEVADFSEKQIRSVVMAWLRDQPASKVDKATGLTFPELVAAIETGESMPSAIFDGVCEGLRTNPVALAVFANEVRFGKIPAELACKSKDAMAFEDITDALRNDNLPDEPDISGH